MGQDIGSFIHAVVGDLHNRFYKRQLDIKRFTILKITIAQVFDQFEAKSFLKIESSVSGAKQKQRKVEINQVGFFGMTRLNKGNAFFDILNPK